MLLFVMLLFVMSCLNNKDRYLYPSGGYRPNDSLDSNPPQESGTGSIE